MQLAASKEIYKRPIPGSTTLTPKTQIELKSIEDRDMIMGHAVNLTKNASIEPVFPDSLKLAAGSLEHFAFRYRSQSNQLTGGKKEVKTQVRYDNTKKGLVLGIREGKDQKWQFYAPNRLPKLPNDAKDMEGIVQASSDEED